MVIARRRNSAMYRYFIGCIGLWGIACVTLFYIGNVLFAVISGAAAALCTAYTVNACAMFSGTPEVLLTQIDSERLATGGGEVINICDITLAEAECAHVKGGDLAWGNLRLVTMKSEYKFQFVDNVKDVEARINALLAARRR